MSSRVWYIGFLTGVSRFLLFVRVPASATLIRSAVCWSIGRGVAFLYRRDHPPRFAPNFAAKTLGLMGGKRCLDFLFCLYAVGCD